MYHCVYVCLCEYIHLCMSETFFLHHIENKRYLFSAELRTSVAKFKIACSFHWHIFVFSQCLNLCLQFRFLIVSLSFPFICSDCFFVLFVSYSFVDFFLLLLRTVSCETYFIAPNFIFIGFFSLKIPVFFFGLLLGMVL